jgi:hypothetical protein
MKQPIKNAAGAAQSSRQKPALNLGGDSSRQQRDARGTPSIPPQLWARYIDSRLKQFGTR